MTDDDHEHHADHEHDPEGEPEHHQSEYATERITAPQSDYTNRDVAVGFVVALVGVAIVFGVPLLFA